MGRGEEEGEGGISMGFTRHGLDRQSCTNNGSLWLYTARYEVSAV